MDQFSSKKLAGAAYCLLRSAYAPLAAAQQEVRSVLRLRDAGLENEVSRDALLERMDGEGAVDGLKEILQSVHLEAHDTDGGFKIAVLRQFIPTLADYVTAHGADQAGYNESRVARRYKVHEAPAFAALDSKMERLHTTWTLPIVGSRHTVIEVAPITKIQQIHQLRNMAPELCYFDPERNHAQMYLYAAHRSATMLGVWKVDRKRARPIAKPLGIIPLLAFQAKSVLPQENAPEVPYLYAEAALLKNECSGTLVRTRERMTSLPDALVDIVAAYASLRAEEPFPVIGTSRKDDADYSGPVRHFIEAAAMRWERFLQNTVRQQNVDNVLGGQPRKATLPRFTSTRYLAMPEDHALLHHLQQQGYLFDSILMHSQAFLDEDDIQRKVGDTTASPRNLLYEAWGEMRGWTRFVSIPEFYPVQHERIFGRAKEVAP